MAMYKDFDEIAVRARELGPKRVAILFPDDAAVMRATAEGMREGLIRPVLIGEKGHIEAVAKEAHLPIEDVEVNDQSDPQGAANLCLDMVIRGEVSFVVKGNILTTYLYRALIRATRQLAPDQTPCTLCFHQAPGINKIFVITDPAWQMPFRCCDLLAATLRGLWPSQPCTLTASLQSSPIMQIG